MNTQNIYYKISNLAHLAILTENLIDESFVLDWVFLLSLKKTKNKEVFTLYSFSL